MRSHHLDSHPHLRWALVGAGVALLFGACSSATSSATQVKLLDRDGSPASVAVQLLTPRETPDDVIDGARPAGGAYALDQDDGDFENVVVIEIPFELNQLTADRDVVFLAGLDEDTQSWVPMPSQVDWNRRVVWAQVGGRSIWRPFACTDPTSCPSGVLGLPAGAPVVVIVRGVNSTWDCEEYADTSNSPRALTGQIMDRLPTMSTQAQFRVFSFSGVYGPGQASPENWWCGDQANYGPDDTCDSIDDDGREAGGLGYASRFREWYVEENLGLPDRPKEVHIIAHSMGGVVVALALAQWADAGEIPDNLKSVVTLDSPLQGHPDAARFINSLVFRAAPGDQCDSDGPALADLLPGSKVIRAIAGLGSKELELITTVGNNQDGVVPAGISYLPGNWLTMRIDEGCLEGGKPFDHGCVFENDDVLLAIIASITTPWAGDQPRPSPQVAENLRCEGRNANVIGSTGPDDFDSTPLENKAISGGPGPDVIVGRGGSQGIPAVPDVILGGGGDDLICGGANAYVDAALVIDSGEARVVLVGENYVVGRTLDQGKSHLENGGFLVESLPSGSCTDEKQPGSWIVGQDPAPGEMFEQTTIASGRLVSFGLTVSLEYCEVTETSTTTTAP